MALLLPVTYLLPAEGALIMLAGIYYGAQYGGSTTAILVNLPGEVELGGHDARRLPDGAPGPRRAGAGDRRHRLVLRRLRRHRGDRGRRAAADAARPAVHAARLLLADGAGPGVRHRAGVGLDPQGARHGVPRHAAGPRRHRRQHRQHALHLRDQRPVRRHRLRAARHGRVRHRRDHRQPDQQRAPRARQAPRSPGCSRPRRTSSARSRPSCAARSSAACSAFCRAAARSWRRSRPTRWRRRSRARPRNSAPA